VKSNVSSRLFLLLAIGLLSLESNAQTEDNDYVLDKPRDYTKYPARNANYIEILGNGDLFSINFDRILFYRKQFKISGRVGAGVMPNGIYFEPSAMIENNYIFFDGNHHLEVGPGFSWFRRNNPKCDDKSTYAWENIFFGMMRIGYRLQKQEEGFFMRIGATPIFYRKTDCVTDNSIRFWGGVAVGMSF
jgi:hypothetical protein